MSTLKEAIYTALNVAGVTSLVPAARLHWLFAPQGTALPYIVIQPTSGTSWTTHTGDTGLDRSTFDVNVFGNSIAECDQVQIACRTALGAAAAQTSGSKFLPEDKNESVTPPVDGSDRYVPQSSKGYIVVHPADS